MHQKSLSGKKGFESKTWNSEIGFNLVKKLNHDRDVLVSHAQAQEFGAEIKALKQGKDVSQKSRGEL
ncbi:hypothetical protein NPIL_207761 [Nephila pilipes]|uniref:Uncharacterized protein n=1 Tax=Nephila pilipes TaxID=299642 RepID=A0A8X6P656_NEPPI|nr:hypothetical protein NPIL_207761 [Nephila pilipes]